MHQYLLLFLAVSSVMSICVLQHADKSIGHTVISHTDAILAHADAIRAHTEESNAHAETFTGHSETSAEHTEKATEHTETSTEHAETSTEHTETQAEHAETSAAFLENFRQTELAKHNEYRALHGVPSISLKDSLNSAAQAYAQSLAANHAMSHSPAAKSGLYGENLYWGWGYPTLTYTLGAASMSWYSEQQYYNYQTAQSNTAGKAIGHFTAMVWKSVEFVGFGYALTSEKGGQAVYIVANYAPTPNVGGRYTSNVFPKK